VASGSAVVIECPLVSDLLLSVPVQLWAEDLTPSLSKMLHSLQNADWSTMIEQLSISHFRYIKI